jgi:high-affinity iron transporter
VAAFLVMLREGLEAALIVGILLAYVSRSAGRREERWVWGGTLSAVLLSVIAGIAVFATVGSLEGEAEAFAEGVIAWAAAALLTWMIFWMATQAKLIRSRLKREADAAMAAGSTWALAAIAFVAVLREGLESTLFLASTAVGTEAGGAQAVGGAAGLAAAVGLGYLIYKGGTRIDIRRFFRITGVLIILFAAGLVAKGVHEFQEVGLLPTLVDPAWDLGFLHPDTSTIGRFLGSLFGWRPDPSALMAAGYLLYLIPVGLGFRRMTARRVVPAPDEAEATFPT